MKEKLLDREEVSETESKAKKIWNFENLKPRIDKMQSQFNLQLLL